MGDLTLSEAVSSGSRKAGLEALRHVLAVSIEQTEPHLRAPLARQLASVIEQLDTLPDAGEETPLDDLTARRAARRGSAAAAQ